jgi:thiol:disulfide interchange protein DsbC
MRRISKITAALLIAGYAFVAHAAHAEDPGKLITQMIQLASQPKIDVNQLDVKDAIKFGSGSRKLYVLSDPDCPYCRRLDEELEKLKDVTIYLFPAPLEQLHPNARRVVEEVWCVFRGS